MNAFAHLAGWIGLFLTAAWALRSATRGGDASAAVLLKLAGVFAAVAVLLHGAATKDMLIVLLAIVWLGLGALGVWREHARAPLALVRGREARRARPASGPPSLVLLRGGRPETRADGAAGSTGRTHR